MKRLLLPLGLLCSLAAHAAPVVQPQEVNVSSIGGSGVGYQGNFSVNQAAGDQQQQVNSRAISLGSESSASNQIRQQVNAKVDPSQAATSRIQGNAFSNGNGALGVNQSAGAANQQANALRVSISAYPQSVDDSVLSQQNVTLPQNSGPGASDSGSRQVVTSDQAFAGSRGVVQLNQSAGVGNRMGNTLSIRVAD